MGDRATLAQAKKELEELYLGVPDDSVNLTFQDFAQVRQENKKKVSPSSTMVMEPISEISPRPPSSPLQKLPSLDFSKGLEASFSNQHQHQQHHHHRSHEDHDHRYNHHHQQQQQHHIMDQRSMGYDDMSHVSMAYGVEGGGRRRPGIPHSNICAVCCNYIYICRHRCLVCGRVYCRQCVSDGMGEMIEGRKCTDCLGRRFSQRYIHRAGNVGWCMGFSSVVKQQELKWAEKGARRSGESRYGGNSVMGPASRSRSPIGRAMTPARLHHNINTPSNPPSFVTNSPYSPYSPTNHHPMPF